MIESNNSQALAQAVFNSVAMAIQAVNSLTCSVYSAITTVNYWFSFSRAVTYSTTLSLSSISKFYLLSISLLIVSSNSSNNCNIPYLWVSKDLLSLDSKFPSSKSSVLSTCLFPISSLVLYLSLFSKLYPVAGSFSSTCLS